MFIAKSEDKTDKAYVVSVSLRNYIIIYYGINLVTLLLLLNYSTVKEWGHMLILLEVINVILQKY